MIRKEAKDKRSLQTKLLEVSIKRLGAGVGLGTVYVHMCVKATMLQLLQSDNMITLSPFISGLFERVSHWPGTS